MAATLTPELLVTNFHRRFTGVSATADAVVSKQQTGLRMCVVGNRLPSGPPSITYREAISLCRRPPADRPFTIWHVRRNLEMSAALVARDVLRLPIRIVFTSAAQRLHSLVPRHLIARMDAVVATTDRAAAFVPNLAAVVPHGVDTDRFRPAIDREQAWRELGFGGRYGIGIVGRVRPEKGTDLFVEAMLRVLPERPDHTALIIGRTMPSESAFEDSLRRRIAAAGLTDRILFIGEQSPQHVPTIIRSLSLLVASARYEGYGMTPLEAMASGVPVVATDTGVYREIIESGVVGEVVPIEDVDRLSGAIAEVTRSAEVLAKMGQAARKCALNKLSLANEVAAYDMLLQRIWEGDRNGRTRERVVKAA